MKLTKFQFSKNFIDFSVTMEGRKVDGYYNPLKSKYKRSAREEFQPLDLVTGDLSALLETSYHLLVESLESAYNDN
jgi:hypothetical protein